MHILIVLNQTNGSNTASYTSPDLIIGVDGGCQYCLDQNLPIDIAVGDFDSLAPASLKRLETKRVVIHRHKIEKDSTDLELALKLAMSYQPRHLSLLGAFGGRIDHSLANLFSIATQTALIPINLPGETQNAWIIKGPERIDFDGIIGATISLLPVSAELAGISCKGLKYPLSKDTIQFGSARGMSNELGANVANIQVKKGIALVILEHNISAKIINLEL